MKAIYFTSPAELRTWLAAHHASHDEVVVGFHKRATRKPSLTWSESVDQALCYGWIDGVRRRVDDNRYTIRFTPRRPGSIWSRINVAKIAALDSAGHLMPAGRRAFEARDDAKTGVYSFERERAATLAPGDAKRFRADPAAWTYFNKQPPSYRRAAYHWVISAKRADTRARRLETLIADSAAGSWVKPLRRRRSP
ncbi:MAG TPA: YdeI/OmpD-associated family protein [Kofleriaceae bacterium]